MTTDNRRKVEQSIAQTGDSGQNSVPLSNSATVGKAERETTLLPSDQYGTYIATMESVVDDINIQEAVKAVISNKGAPGIDGITTEEIKGFMREQWPKIKQDLLEGRYRPQPVRRVEIPKPDGNGVRQLGIPTVMDRIIQQAIHQELVPVFEPIFSEHSHGFRPNRSARKRLIYPSFFDFLRAA